MVIQKRKKKERERNIDLQLVMLLAYGENLNLSCTQTTTQQHNNHGENSRKESLQQKGRGWFGHCRLLGNTTSLPQQQFNNIKRTTTVVGKQKLLWVLKGKEQNGKGSRRISFFYPSLSYMRLKITHTHTHTYIRICMLSMMAPNS